MGIKNISITVERIGMGILAAGVGLFILVIILTAVGLSQWLWILPAVVCGLGFIVLAVKVVYDRFTDEENTKYGNVD